MIEFDYIILGAGSAGCVLANRLSMDGTRTVAVLEAGPMDHKLMVHIPAGVYSAHMDPSINWNYDAEPEETCDGRSIWLPRGKVIGGSSSINSMVYIRGHPLDYDRWATRPGLAAWSHAHCLPYFKRCESSDRGENPWRGGSGPLGVTRGRLDNPLFDALSRAGEQSGQGTSEDLNGYRPEGIARLDSTIRDGRRCSAAVAHLRPALARPNVTLVTGALANRILLERSRAVGVEIERRGETFTVRAGREVIVSCGAIKSPQLLMLSGIGEADALRAAGVRPAVNLPGVGRNLRDHLALGIAYECIKPVTLERLAHPLMKMRVGVEWLATRTGIGASNIWEMGGFVYGNRDVPHPNLQYHFTPVYSEYEGTDLRLFQGYHLHCDQLRPRSRGTVTLASIDPRAAPVARFNYLQDPYDVRELIEGVRVSVDLMTQPAFDEFRGRRIAPSPSVNTDEEIEAFVRATATTDFHPCGTCAMGEDASSVVDGELRVHGVDGLRVVDASVMPDIVSGNLNAPTQMIAERASDFILGRGPLAPQRPGYHFETTG